MASQDLNPVKCVDCDSFDIDRDDTCDNCDAYVCRDCLMEPNNNSGEIACSEDCLEQLVS